jgi:Rieske Fe-S protein
MESGVTRRGLISGAVVAVGAGIVGYAVANNSSYASRKSGSTAANSTGYGSTSGGARKQLTTLSAVPIGGGIVLSKKDVVVTRDDNGDVHAFSATCTHQGCQVTEVRDGQIFCPCHGSRFSASTGNPVAGPAPRPLPTVAVTVEGDAIFTG